MVITPRKLWDMLNLAAKQALPSTDIPRVPVIKPELHEIVWEIHKACRGYDWWTGTDELRRIALSEHNGPVGEVLTWARAFDEYGILMLRVCTLAILGLRQWER